MVWSGLAFLSSLVLAWFPLAGILRAYSFDRFEATLAARVWRGGAIGMIVAFLVFATPWGLAAVAEAIAEAAPARWAAGWSQVYRYDLMVLSGAAALGGGAAAYHRLPAGSEERRAAAVAVTVALLVFLATQWPAINASHCPLFREGLIHEGFCAVER